MEEEPAGMTPTSKYSKELLEAQASRSFLTTSRSSTSEDLSWVSELMQMHQGSASTLGESSKSIRDHNREALSFALQSLDDDDFDVESLEVLTRSQTLVYLGMLFCYRCGDRKGVERGIVGAL
jgi:hypothetical protein